MQESYEANGFFGILLIGAFAEAWSLLDPPMKPFNEAGKAKALFSTRKDGPEPMIPPNLPFLLMGDTLEFWYTPYDIFLSYDAPPILGVFISSCMY